MTFRREPEASEIEATDGAAPASLLDALLVYAEPLAAGVHVIVLGDAESSAAGRLLDLGARAVYVFDPDPARAAAASRRAPRGVTVRPLVDELDVRDGAFDLAVVPDLSELNDPRDAIGRLRRAVASTGSVLAMGRARLGADQAPAVEVPFAADLGPAALDYAELYDLFAMQFDEVSLACVVPFSGAVFAELGGDGDPPAVSVDTRLASGDPPSVFAIVAGHRSDRARRPELDPYAIVELPPREATPRDAVLELEATVAAARLEAELLRSQIEELRERLAEAESRAGDSAARLERAASERDGALTRAMELEAVLAASQLTMATLERRLLEAEQGMLERDDRIATLSAELDALRAGPPFGEAPAFVDSDFAPLAERAERAEAALAVALAELSARQENADTTEHLGSSLAEMRDRVERAEAALAAAVEELNARRDDEGARARAAAQVDELRDRAERAEAGLALHVADLAHVADAHAKETESYEEQLRDRARVIAALEKELVRREQLVKELVASLEESREGANGAAFEAATPLPVEPTVRSSARAEDTARLLKKLDELAAEVARREGELVARAWKITELENRLREGARPAPGEPAADVGRSGGRDERTASQDGDVREALARARDELDALRQALTQEHAARVAAESGEELARARSELARQAALLEQVRGRAGAP